MCDNHSSYAHPAILFAEAAVVAIEGEEGAVGVIDQAWAAWA